MSGYRISKIKISQFGGVEVAEHEIPPQGVIFSGRNGSGKTSRLRGIEYALEAAGLTDSITRIHHGAEKSEILVELRGDAGEVATVKRSITANGAQTPRIEIGEGKSTSRPSKPMSWLETAIGRPALDPLAFFRAPPKKQRDLLLEALPITATPAQLAAFAPVPEGFSTAGHGLEVAARLCEHWRAKRAEANAKAKTAAEDAKRAAADAAARPPASAGSPTLEEAQASAVSARGTLAKLEAQADAAKAAEARTAVARGRVAGLRSNAGVLTAEAKREIPDEAVVEAASNRVDAAHGEVTIAEERVKLALEALRVAESALRTAEQTAEDAREALDRLSAKGAAARAKLAQAQQSEQQANDLEATIAAVGGVAPAPEAVEAARLAVAAAEAAREAAQAERTNAAVRERAQVLAGQATEAEREAAVLDGHVQALTKQAPAALLATVLGAGGDEGDLLSGISIDGDAIFVTIDKAPVRLDSLCGAERIRLAVDLAKRLAGRANARLKTFLIHELEAIDEETRHAFLGYLVADGWQVIAAQVAKGALRTQAVEALLVEEEAPAAV